MTKDADDLNCLIEYVMQYSNIANTRQKVKKSNIYSFWYAIYTKPCHEKKVFAELQQQKINSYLPIRTIIRQWSDRKKKLTEPLFSCYLFVYITMKEYYNVLNIPGVVRFISFGGKAAIIPEKQIRLMRNLLEQDVESTEIPETISMGTKVEIIAGPLTGIKGELVDFAGKKRVNILIEEIFRSILVNVPLKYLKFYC